MKTGGARDGCLPLQRRGPGVLRVLALCLVWIVGVRSQTPPTSATVPLDASTNCAIVEFSLTRADGSERKARFVVDTGGGAFIISELLANDIGAKRIGPEMKEGGEVFAPISTPALRLGAMPVDLTGVPAVATVGTKRLGTRDDAEGMIPGRLLRKYHVVFDYPASTFTLAAPGSMKPIGERLPAPIGRTGFPRIELTIAGETNAFLLDTGATYTMISAVVLDRWSKAQPSWPRSSGAVGLANMFGGPMEAEATMLRLAGVGWGGAKVDSVAAVSRLVGTFEQYMSGMMTAPIVGAIGGNILKIFRIEIDYANGMVYVQKSGAADPHDTDVVGLTLQTNAAGVVTIAGVSTANAPAVVSGVRPGDRLRQIDGREVDGMTLSAIQRALSGKPGDVKTLVIERGGERLTVKAVVSRIL